MAGKAVKIVEALPTDLAGAVMVVETSVTIGDTARPIAEKLEAKASEKRAAANLPPVDLATPRVTRPGPDEYATLPITQMMPLEVEDVTREWGLTNGRPVKLVITIDTVKTANAGMAMLLGSTDELAGMVDVLNPATGARLGEFYVDVLNARSGVRAGSRDYISARRWSDARPPAGRVRQRGVISGVPAESASMSPPYLPAAETWVRTVVLSML